jgi:hypothetical protein
MQLLSGNTMRIAYGAESLLPPPRKMVSERLARDTHDLVDQRLLVCRIRRAPAGGRRRDVDGDWLRAPRTSRRCPQPAD